MDTTVLGEAWRLADEVFRPQAEIADQGDIHGVVEQNIRLLSDAGYLGLGIEPEYGGLGAEEAVRHELTEIVASACGVTAFTQQQLHVAISYIVGARGEALKRDLLPQLATGKILCGIALSQLRRPGAPMVRAERVDGGFKINGIAPWVSGWELLDSFILGAATSDTGEHLYVYVDIKKNAAALHIGPRLPLLVMGASSTIEVTVEDLFIPNEFVLNEHPVDELRRYDFRCITSHAALPLGCARGCANYLRALATERHQDPNSPVLMALLHEIDQSRREAVTWNCNCVDMPDYKTNALRARARAIVLAMRAAQATVAVTGGSAHLQNKAPQRFVREAQFYTTVAQIPDVQENVLDHLLSPFFAR